MKYKIYRIVDNTNGNVYYGITKQKYVCERISTHRLHYKNNIGYCSSRIILENNDWFYELVEETDDPEREKYYIRNTPNCINKNLKKDFDMKEWRLKNKTKLDEDTKQYYIDNKIKMNKQCREYHHKNKEHCNKMRREHYQNNLVNDKKTRDWKSSWGGDKRSNNNLLCIDLDIFD